MSPRGATGVSASSFEDGDQDIYCDFLSEQMRKAEVAVWAYC